MTPFLDRLRSHLERTETHHLRPLILDIISVFEDRENNAVRLVREEFEVFSDHIQGLVNEVIREGIQEMSKALETLQASVSGLASAVTAHDQVVQTAVSSLKTAAANGDQQGILDAAQAISNASAKLSAETTAISDALGASNAAANGAPAVDPVAPAAPAAAPAAADPAAPAADAPVADSTKTSGL